MCWGVMIERYGKGIVDYEIWIWELSWEGSMWLGENWVKQDISDEVFML
jgi:hypothetical protein